MSSGSTTGSRSTSSWLQRMSKSPRLVEDVRDAAAHPGGEVPPCRAQHYHAPVGHVLAAVVAHAIDDGVRAAVADTEAFARQAADEHLAAGGAVEGHVANDDVLLGHKRRLPGRGRYQPPAGDALAEIVVGVALQRETRCPWRGTPRSSGPRSR